MAEAPQNSSFFSRFTSSSTSAPISSQLEHHGGAGAIATNLPRPHRVPFLPLFATRLLGFRVRISVIVSLMEISLWFGRPRSPS